MQHQPVLLKEVLLALLPTAEGIYVDGTFGRGGHSREILRHLGANGRLVAIDKDEEAIAVARAEFKDDDRFTIVRDSFANIDAIARDLGIDGKINGVLLDLGVSSPQLDNPLRGFSFMHDGPLDMRMDNTGAQTAADFVNQSSIEEMTRVFRTYGEERYAGRIARAIAEARITAPIMTTAKLASIVSAANPAWEKHKHPATRIFQAIRIYINNELEDLLIGLKRSLAVLANGGRLAVISFHSLEDRIVKQFMRDQEEGEKLPARLPVRTKEVKKTFARIGKAIKASAAEVMHNPRARSAVLRVGEKLS